MKLTTSTMIFTDVNALSERYGRQLNRINVQSTTATVRTHIHVGYDSTITAETYDSESSPFITIDIRGKSNNYESDTALFFRLETMDKLVALRDACNVALRKLRKMED